MAKVSIKSEKITSLGVFFMRESIFPRFADLIIDKLLDSRCGLGITSMRDGQPEHFF